MTTFVHKIDRTVVGITVILLLAFGAECLRGQAVWLKDASEAKIPAGAVKGQLNGKPVTFTNGRLSISGNMTLGDLQFPHYILYLQDGENAFYSKFSAQITVVVRKGERPDGKTFRSNLAPRETRAGLRGDGYWIPELYSVMLTIRRGEEFGSGSNIVTTDSDQQFTGRVEFENRKGDKLTAHLYISYNDDLKSWFAGTIDVSIE